MIFQYAIQRKVAKQVRRSTRFSFYLIVNNLIEKRLHCASFPCFTFRMVFRMWLMENIHLKFLFHFGHRTNCQVDRKYLENLTVPRGPPRQPSWYPVLGVNRRSINAGEEEKSVHKLIFPICHCSISAKRSHTLWYFNTTSGSVVLFSCLATLVPFKHLFPSNNSSVSPTS